jgi:hypothetical protein
VASRPKYSQASLTVEIVGGVNSFTFEPSKKKFKIIEMKFQTDVMGNATIRLENTTKSDADATVFVDRVKIVEVKNDDVDQGKRQP